MVDEVVSEKLREAVVHAVNEGSLSKAARVLMSKGIWSLSRSVLSELQSLHPEGDLGLFQPVGNSVAPHVFFSKEVMVL